MKKIFRILIAFITLGSGPYGYAASPLAPEGDLGGSGSRTFESRGNALFPFSMLVGTTTAVYLYQVCPDSNTAVFQTKRWHRSTVIKNPSNFALAVTTWAAKAADPENYDVVFPSTTETIYNHDDLYVRYVSGGSSMTLRGRLERE